MPRALGLWRAPRPLRAATAIEFAILFPMFFLILDGIITYGMIFAAQQSLTLAATEGARAARSSPVSRPPSAAAALAAAARSP
ncbi:TadE family protein, partial [Burkholderia pseudomallei]